MTPPVKGMPLYLQVRDEILRRISSGRLRIGSWLPNEQELSQTMNVSIGTVRKAMELLEAANIVRREQGRGTRVLDPETPIWTMMFSNLRDRTGQRVEGQLRPVRQEIILADAVTRERMKLADGDQIIKEVRVRELDGLPQVFEDISIAMTRLSGLTGLPREGYRLASLAFEHGVLLGQAVEEICVKPLSVEIAVHLGTTEGTVGLKLDRIVYSTEGEPIHWRLGYGLLKTFTYVTETWAGAPNSMVGDFVSGKGS